MGIGLTDFIKIDEVRREIDTTYPNPSNDVDGELQIANHGYSHRLIGEAFEFLCRLWIHHQCNVVIEPWRRWGQNRFEEGETPEILLAAENVDEDELERVSRQAEQFIETGLNTDRAVNAALLDAGWRQVEEEHSGLHLDMFEDDLVTEMRALFEQLRAQDWPCGEVAYHSPDFGRHSHILEGEGDFIVDDLLVDIKTTEDGTFTPAHWRQLLSYYILNDIQRVLYEETERGSQEKYPAVTELGIYFARYGELQTVTINDVIDDRAEYERFRAWFVNRAIEENHDKRVNYTDIRATLTEPYDYERQRTLFDDY